VDIDTANNLSARLTQARGVVAALLVDLSDPTKGPSLRPDSQSAALWAVDTLLSGAEKCLDD